MKWLDDLVLGSFVFRNCGTGAGGFQPGNSCAGGGDSSGDGAVSSESSIKTDDGRQIPLIEVTNTRNAGDYIDTIETEGSEMGMAVNFEEASRLQEIDGVTDRTSISAYASDAFSVFTDAGTLMKSSTEDWKDDPVASIIDRIGADQYGTITYHQEEQMIEERWTEFKRTFGEMDRVSVFGDTWNQMSDSQKKEAEARFMIQKRLEIKNGVRDQRDNAREVAIKSMRKSLEVGLATSKLGCCLQVYRGITSSGFGGSKALEDTIKTGYIAHRGPNSWTTSRETALRFSRDYRDGGVVLVSRKPRAGWINKEDFGKNGEKEVVRPPSKMRITKVVRVTSRWNERKTYLFLDEDEDYR